MMAPTMRPMLIGSNFIVFTSREPRSRRVPLSMGSGIGENPNQLNHGRSEDDDEKLRKDAQHERKNELDRGFPRRLLGALPPPGPQRLSMDPQGFSDARAEPIALNQYRSEGARFLDARAQGEIAQRLGPI